MVVTQDRNRRYKCPRCGGLGTIPTPDGKHNEVCPICNGTGKVYEPFKKKGELEWRS